MISKERLEELIEKGATIYRTYANVSVQEVKLNKNCMKVDNAFLWQKMTGAFKGCGTPLEKLFETKEEAEWHKEFGCVERTERLELPTWEEIKHDFIYNKQSAGNYCVVEFFGFQEYSLDIVVYNGDAMITISDEDFYEPLTKENYTLACRKAKELFLGETKC